MSSVLKCPLNSHLILLLRWTKSLLGTPFWTITSAPHQNLKCLLIKTITTPLYDRNYKRKSLPSSAPTTLSWERTGEQMLHRTVWETQSWFCLPLKIAPKNIFAYLLILYDNSSNTESTPPITIRVYNRIRGIPHPSTDGCKESGLDWKTLSMEMVASFSGN